MAADELALAELATTNEAVIEKSAVRSSPAAAHVLDAVPFGRIYAHRVRQSEAIQLILARVDQGTGGFVVTPNVDHICIAENDPELRAAYQHAFLSLPDGKPLVWMAKSYGTPLAEKVSGSDILEPLLREAARLGKSVYFLGSNEPVCLRAAEKLRVSIPALRVVGWSCPRFDPYADDQSEITEAIEKIQLVRPDLVLVALGNPKQEYAMLRYSDSIAPGVALGVGASIDFLAGVVNRSPEWMSESGLEWLYRLTQEPGRMWRRYLVRDRAILGIFLRTRRRVRSERADRT